MKKIIEITQDLIHILYPHVCTGCGSDLISEKQQLCLSCLEKLPHTHFAKHPNNPIEKVFTGRIPVSAAHCEFYFAKDSLIQHLVHQLKYNGNRSIGEYLGRLLGESLLSSGRFTGIDALVPLPMFPDKERKRGYNQATVICQGISIEMNIPLMTGNVVRSLYTETQTQKNRTERWDNVRESFSILDAGSLFGKKIMLVDDVITTGATLEACGHQIIHKSRSELFIASLAMAEK